MAPEPYVDPSIITRAVTGTSEPADAMALAEAVERLAGTLADVLQRGIKDGDYPTMHRARATADAVSDAFRAVDCERARARAAQVSVFGAGGAEGFVTRALFAGR